MGIIADTMAEAVQRSAADFAGVLTDLRQAGKVEVIADDTGKIWVNVDGVCALRIQQVTYIAVNTTAVDPAFKEIKP